ncbi:MAG: chalcone isomerase family protein [Burkholderiaceae bacterium]
MNRLVVSLAVVACASAVMPNTNPITHANATTELTPSSLNSQVVDIPAAVRDALPNVRLSGEGLLRWFGFRIYEARLFVGEGYDHKRPMQGPIALDLTYKRSFDGPSIAERSADEIESLGIGSATQRAQWASQMAGLFPDVNAGDRLTGILTASGRTLFTYNDQAVGTIDDPAFGPAFFAIWLDEQTSAPQLRAQLIGKSDNATPLYESAQ